MKVFFVKSIISFGDFESPERSERVSDYFYNRNDAQKYMEDHFPKSSWGNTCWNTVYVTSDDLVIR